MTVEEFNYALKNIKDKNVFDVFFDEYYPKIVRKAILYCNYENARDVANEIFTYLLTHDPPYVENPKAWLWALCKYNCQKFYTKNKIEDCEIPDKYAIYDYIFAEYRMILSQLHKDESMVLILYWYYGYSIEEIAKIMNKSYNAIAKLHTKAKKNFKKLLAK